ncbi:MAG TPA: phospholipase D family protein, partial [Archangium sp.]|nr:phospholipase D family protein [Archangium sp.]
DRTRAFARNHPLADFIKALPGMAQAPLAAPQLEAVERVADELRRVQFTPPEPFADELTFWPLGIPGYKQFPLKEPMDRLLIISPFVHEEVLQQRMGAVEKRLLISRAEELDRLPAGALEGYETYTLAEGAEPTLSTESDSAESDTEVPAASEYREARGLHAKIYLAEHGWDATLWTGSANATRAAFGKNVELLIQLRGRRSQIGIEPLLDRSGKNGGLFRLLQPYTPSEAHPPLDEEGLRNEERLEACRRELSRAGLRLEVRLASSGIGHDLQLGGALPAGLLESVEASAWPVTLRPSQALDMTPLTRGESLTFANLSTVSLTAFLEVTLEAGTGDAHRALHFVLNLPLEGAPADRHEQLLREVIGNRGQLLRYLLFLLAREEDAMLAGQRLLQGDPDGTSSWTASGAELPLLEEMLRTLSRAPAQLDAVARLITDLEKTPEGRELLPPGFNEVWNPIWQARQEVQ